MTLVITDGEFWGWRLCALFNNDMIFILIFLSLFIKGSIKGPKKGVITDFTYSRAKILDAINVEELNSRNIAFLIQRLFPVCKNLPPTKSSQSAKQEL
ncbi:hypothetical protein [Enterobacter hormaechei]